MQPERPFDQPWQAKAFALTVHLHERGLFTWDEWTDAFATRRRFDVASDDGSDYYDNWAATLEELLIDRGVTDAEKVRLCSDAWSEAAHNTPHGQPIELPTGSTSTAPSARIES